jgi:hypothetical protein
MRGHEDESWEVGMKPRMEIPKKVKENRRERKKTERFEGVHSLWFLGLIFLGVDMREANGESESK